MDNALVSTRLEGQTYKALQELAQREERKIAFLVRKAVEEYVKAKQRKGRQAA